MANLIDLQLVEEFLETLRPALREADRIAALENDPAWHAHLEEQHEAWLEQASYERGDYAPPPRE